MAQRLAIERSHKFAAIAVVAASLSESLASRFTPSRSIPILLCTGQPILSHPMKEAGSLVEHESYLLKIQ
jgi:poly(3-hydroxybutyrate) depolymerase